MVALAVALIMPGALSPQPVVGATADIADISVTPFAQNVGTWSGDALGSCGTIAAKGCAVTSLTMVLGFYHIVVPGGGLDPGQVTQYMRNHGLEPCDMPWASAAALFGLYERDTWSLTDVDNELLAGRPAIAWVQSDTAPSHFVVVVGKSGGVYHIVDPQNGVATDMANGSFGAYQFNYAGPAAPFHFYTPSKGIIGGRVLMPNGQGASGASVTLTAGGWPLSALTDATGAYLMPAAPSGPGRVSAKLTSAGQLLFGAVTVTVLSNASSLAPDLQLSATICVATGDMRADGVLDTTAGDQCPPPPAPTTCVDPASSQVTLYGDKNYAGVCQTLDIGTYNDPSAFATVGNDNVESIRIGGSVKAELCRDNGLSNTCEWIEQSDADLSNNSVGANQVSSIKVEALPSTPPPCTLPNADQVTIYADQNYGGACATFAIGDYGDPSAFGAVGNDNVESIRVGTSVKAELCRDSGLSNTCEWFEQSDPNLSDNSVNVNTASSLSVQWNTGTGNCSSPGSNQVAVFVDENFGGQCSVRTIGTYNDPAAIGLPNDSISSVKVGSGVQAVLCRDNGISNTCEWFSGDDSRLADNSVGDNQVSSMRVEVRPPQPGPCDNPGDNYVALFVDENYGGQCVVRGVGDYASPSVIGLPNDAISSLRVGAAVKAELCRDNDFSNTCEWFDYSDGRLADNSVNDNQVSSVRVTWRVPPPDRTPPSASWLAPADSATVTASSLTLQVNATDDGALQSVAFSAAWSGTWHNDIGEAVVSGTSAIASYTWDLCAAGVPDGDVELGVQVVDAAGNVFHYSDMAANPHVTKSFDCVPPPTAPANVSVTAVSSHSLEFDWEDRSDNEAGFAVYRFPGPSVAGWELVGLVTAGETTFTDDGLAPSTDYSYFACAFNAGGTSCADGWMTGTTEAAGPATFEISGPASWTAGTVHSLTVTARDASGNVATGYRGTVHLSSTDAAAGLGSDYTFTDADAGVHVFPGIILKTAGSQSVTATDTSPGGITGTLSGIVVTPGRAVSLAVSTTGSWVAGGSHSVYVTAKDAYGNRATGYRGTVRIWSSDPQAVTPADYVFTSADRGVRTFVVTLKTAGTQSINAADTVTPSIAGSQGNLNVRPGAARSLLVTTATSWVAGGGHSVYATAKDAYGNTATAYAGTVRISSSDGQAVLPADYTFTSADRGVHRFVVTLKTAGTQQISVTDTANASITRSQGNIVVRAGAVSSFTVTTASTWSAGGSHSVYVTAKDAYGNTVTGYTGTVRLTSSDAAAGLPGDYTFTSADKGVHRFVVTLATPGTQSITATDLGNPSVHGSKTGIAVA